LRTTENLIVKQGLLKIEKYDPKERIY